MSPPTLVNPSQYRLLKNTVFSLKVLLFPLTEPPSDDKEESNALSTYENIMTISSTIAKVSFKDPKTSTLTEIFNVNRKGVMSADRELVPVIQGKSQILIEYKAMWTFNPTVNFTFSGVDYVWRKRGLFSSDCNPGWLRESVK